MALIFHSTGAVLKLKLLHGSAQLANLPDCDADRMSADLTRGAVPQDLSALTLQGSVG